MEKKIVLFSAHLEHFGLHGISVALIPSKRKRFCNGRIKIKVIWHIGRCFGYSAVCCV